MRSIGPQPLVTARAEDESGLEEVLRHASPGLLVDVSDVADRVEELREAEIEMFQHEHAEENRAAHQQHRP